MNGRLSFGSAAAACLRIAAWAKSSEAVIWKFVLVLLITAIAIPIAQLIADAPGHPDARGCGEPVADAGHSCLCRASGGGGSASSRRTLGSSFDLRFRVLDSGLRR